MAQRLNAEIHKILATPDIAKKITELGGDIRTDTPEQFATWVNAAIAEWGAVVKAENIQID